MSAAESDVQFASDVTAKCFSVYRSIGKKGKPQAGREWTKMASIVKTDLTDTIEVITLATGTKCIGEKHRGCKGYLLNDSHAEVLAKRLLLRYLYKQILVYEEDSNKSIFSKSNGMFYLKDGIKFHLFSTDIPCGDASIFPQKSKLTIDRKSTKRKHTETDDSIPVIKMTKYEQMTEKPVSERTINIGEVDGTDISAIVEYRSEDINRDIHRTGAKCVPGGKQDLLEDGESYHVIGALRIKPGRGDRTISMSCSDKIMKWCILGIQGGLLANLLKLPIYLSSIIISNVNFDRAALLRAISPRGRLQEKDEIVKRYIPVILQTNMIFPDSKESVMESSININNDRITPTGAAILYCPACNIHEISSTGRKHGITKKDFNTPKAKTSVCKSALFDDFKLCKNILDTDKLCEAGENKQLTYFDHKHSSIQYEEKRKEFFQIFHEWMRKPKEEELFL